MTPLTFDNHLKFGIDSCHNAEGRPTFLHREREHLKLCANTHHHIYREGPSNGAPHAQELSPQQVVEQEPTMAAAIFPLPPRSRLSVDNSITQRRQDSEVRWTLLVISNYKVNVDRLVFARCR